MNKNKELLKFIESSPSVFHVIENGKNMLIEKGYTELEEKEDWKISFGGKYFVTRNDSSLIAFCLPKDNIKGFHIVASHSDSPCFKIKENPEIIVEEQYVKLNTEKYGGMIHSTWLDRPLSVAGRVVIKDKKGKLQRKLVNLDKDLLVIPNLAIHMNREMNNGYEYNAQVDMLPLLGNTLNELGKNSLIKEIAQSILVEPEDILGHDLFLYVRDKGRIIGANNEFVLSPKLDDLQCVFTSLEALLASENNDFCSMIAIFDNEEVGSGTRQGADSTFLSDTIERIGEVLDISKNQYCKWIAESFLISADNAHAIHPNRTEKADPTNRPYLNGGIVIKYHGSQKYTTDAISTAKIKLLCEEVKVPYQTFANRSDLIGGSTLGNISTAHVSLASVDIGLPQLAMHSAVETGGTKDTDYAIKVFTKFFSN